ncbi:hypothetical protein [Desulfosporosinus sp. OT]|uniref:hypothetical protein n=1 Tax=Desulfosporosinus sp. OT TaxID=913865 RepID=UPI000223B054|nr:hypothetical protein [Desulfosporosinus sp. OT]EGW40194.1 putative membrane protein [Desulfosporosinus sp. OT]
MVNLEKNERSPGQGAPPKRVMTAIEYVGLALVATFMLGLFFKPNTIAGVFDAMVNNAYSIFKAFIFGNWNNGVWSPSTVGVAIIVSVMTGRILERLGFTDALIRIFVPIMKYFRVNSAVVIPAVYNILGDINAAGRIAGPILVKAGATKDEQKIAVATMVQSQQSFSTLMLGLLAMTTVGIKVFPVVFIAVFLPLIIVPPLLRLTIYRDAKAVSLQELPRFTPKTAFLPTIFGAAREGAEVLFLLIIPAGVVIYAIIGGLDFAGIWAPIKSALTSMLSFLSIDPTTGIISVLVSPTLAMGTLKATLAANPAAVAPRLVIGSFVLACSGFPFSVIFGQIPAVWAGCTDLSEREAMVAAILGAVMKLISTGLIARLLGQLFF